MGNFGNRKDSPGFWLSFFLLLGAAAGTLFCNWPDSGWKEALRDAGSGMVTAAMLLKLDFMGLFFTVLRKRLGEAFCLILFSMTPAAPQDRRAAPGCPAGLFHGGDRQRPDHGERTFRDLPVSGPGPSPGGAVYGCILCDGLVDGGGEKEDDSACGPGAGPGSSPGSGGGKLCESVDNCLDHRMNGGKIFLQHVEGCFLGSATCWAFYGSRLESGRKGVKMCLILWKSETIMRKTARFGQDRV